jgi:hypothetical protein
MHAADGGFQVGRHLRQAAADALGFVAHVFQAIDAFDHALLVVRLHYALGLLGFLRQLVDAVADFVRRVLRGLASLFGFADGLLNMSKSLLDFVCLQHDVLLCVGPDVVASGGYILARCHSRPVLRHVAHGPIFRPG